MSLRDYLERWARTTGLPHVLAAEGLDDGGTQMSALLVGSVATGLCQEGSDVDIALLCDASTYARLSPWRDWLRNRPTELRFGKQQLHYYAATFDEVLRRVDDLDDRSLYVYGTAKVLLDPGGLFASRVVPAIQRPGLRKERLEGKLDMLLRRTKALSGEAKRRANALVLAEMSLEVSSLALKVIALLDDIPFDPRKRLVETALAGPHGQEMAGPVAEMIRNASQWQDGNDAFTDRLGHVCQRLCQAAAHGGFAVGLRSPDQRAQER